jgi:hypothetical protein
VGKIHGIGDKAIAELAIVLVDEAVQQAERSTYELCQQLEWLRDTIQRADGTLQSSVGGLANEIGEHRIVLKTAADAADRNSAEMTKLTNRLIFATKLYVVLTAGLLIVAITALIFESYRP